jgi:hypothetical protein
MVSAVRQADYSGLRSDRWQCELDLSHRNPIRPCKIFRRANASYIYLPSHAAK